MCRSSRSRQRANSSRTGRTSISLSRNRWRRWRSWACSSSRRTRRSLRPMRCAISLTFRPSCSSSRNAARRRAAQLRHGRSGCLTIPGHELRLFFRDGVLIAVGAHSPRDGIRRPIACQARFPPTDLGMRLSASLSPGGFDLPCFARAAIHRVAPRVAPNPDFAPSSRSATHRNRTTKRFPPWARRTRTRDLPIMSRQL